MLTAWQLACSVDWKRPILLTPGANRIEIFETEPERVHLLMTGGAMRVGAVTLHALAQ